jgi:hypothetical protein
MDSDDEEMRDASSASVSGDDDDAAGYEVAPEGMVVMEVRWFEVDLDYEFDAPRWFDLAQEEAPVEAAAAEMWFATAPSYPPSRTSPSPPAPRFHTNNFVFSSPARGGGTINPTRLGPPVERER